MLNRLLARVFSSPGTPPPGAVVPQAPLSPAVVELQARVTELAALCESMSRAETVRNAEHMAMCDRLDRLYKRLAARAARADDSPHDNGDSVLALRGKLGR